MADWNHSVVIYSLLQRPDVLDEWNAILEGEGRSFIGFGWEPSSTGRVEGYPDSNSASQLQDALEYYTTSQDPTTLARLAFDLAVTKVDRDHPPPVPPKDHDAARKCSFQDIRKETDEWQLFMNSIIEDEQLPTGVTYMEDGSLDDLSGSWLDLSL